MDYPTYAAPEPEPPRVRTHDLLAVALGNASLLGIGYLMLGRRKLVVATGVVTAVLVSVLALAARSVWFEVVVLVWWAAVIAHGWFLAGGRARRVAERGQRLVALGVTVPVLLAVGLLRFDATGIERSVAEARDSGDCEQVVIAQDRVWFGHRMAGAPLTARGDKSVQACRRLQTAMDELAHGLSGDTGALKTGFDTLAAVLAEPGNDKTAAAVLDWFLRGVPATSPCEAAAVTDWLRHRRASHNALDRSAATVPRTAPAALVGCGDDLMADEDWTQARTRYQQLLDLYPGNALTAKARDGVKRATLSIELANVRSLLEGPTDSQPEYCDTPAKYSGAAPYRKGRVNRALFYGNDTYTKRLPGRWRTTDAARAVLVVCADERDQGTAVQTCPYQSRTSSRFTSVTFHKIAIPVKVYELRTGKKVADRKVQINGASCPPVIRYTTYSGLSDPGPDPDQYVKPSNADVRAAFSPLINR
jgi:hypothetical protein